MDPPSSSRVVSLRFPQSPSAHSPAGGNGFENDQYVLHHESKELFGLFHLNKADFRPSLHGFDETTQTFNADIIAIHGLGGTAFETWTHHSNGKNWLRDFAPNEFPGARIYTFGYDSSFAFSRGTGSLNDFARSFLEAIKLERSSPEQQRRRLVLVCHSMGGIVAKLAITIAKKEPENYPGIGDAVAGYILAKTANVLVTGIQASRLLGRMRPDLLKVLDKHSPQLVAVSEEFLEHAEKIPIVSFIEGKKTLGLNERVVDDQSAHLGAPLERTIPMPGYDHKGLCRHASTGDAGMKLILFEIRRCLPNTSLLKSIQVPFFPFQRNIDFVGQENILQALLDGFQQQAVDREVALYGLGGIGKSQIAVEYAHLLLEMYPETQIFWVFGGTQERFEQDYLSIARRLELPGFDAPEVDVLALVKGALEKKSNWMMIIDNADDSSLFWGASEDAELEPSSNYRPHTPEGLSKYIPTAPNGFILYTTRTKEDAIRLTGEGNVLKVAEMDDKSLETLLKNKLKGAVVEDGDLARLVTVLDRLPLAIVQAASFIRHMEWSIPQYLTNFEAEGSVTSSGPFLHEFQDKTRDGTVWNSVFRTWMITMKQLEKDKSGAAETLQLMSFYNRQDIPHYLLLGPCPSSIGWRTIRADTNYRLGESVAKLKSYSFLTMSEDPEDQRYTLHRLVQKFVQYWLEHRGIAGEYASKALDCLLDVFPLEEYENWRTSAELLPHVQTLVDCRFISTVPADKFGILLTAASRYLRMKGQVQRADNYITIALTALRSDLGDDDPVTIDAFCEQGCCCQELKQFKRAEELFRTAIRSYTRVFGDEHVKVYQAMILLSGLLRVLERFPEGERIVLNALEGLKNCRESSADRVELLGQMSLAKILGDRQSYNEALEIQRKVARTISHMHDSEHPRLISIRHDLAITLFLADNLDEAEITSKEVLALCEKVYGPDHHRTAKIVYNLARVLRRQNDLVGAKPLFERALQLFQTLEGDSSPSVMQCLGYLAANFEDQGDVLSALQHYQKAHKLLLSDFGPMYEGTQNAQEDIDRIQGLISRDPGIIERHRLTLEENLVTSAESINMHPGHPRTPTVRGRGHLAPNPTLPSPLLSLQGTARLDSQLRTGESSSKRTHNESHYYTSDRNPPYSDRYVSESGYMFGGNMLVPDTASAPMQTTPGYSSAYYLPHMSTGAGAENTAARSAYAPGYASVSGYTQSTSSRRPRETQGESAYANKRYRLG